MKRYDSKQNKRSKNHAQASRAGSTLNSQQNTQTTRARARRDDSTRVARRRQKLVEAYCEGIATAEKLAEPKGIYVHSTQQACNELSHWLPENATAAYFGLCTLGDELDRYFRNLVENDLASASVLNEVALAWIVNITQDLHQRVRDEVGQNGLKTGAAYRPGLGRWPLDVQKTVFAELPAEQIGVCLSESLVMKPGFSTSLVIPILTSK